MVPLDSPETSTRRVVRGACPHDCPDTCAMLVTVENGRAIEIRGRARPSDRPAARCARRSRAISTARIRPARASTRCGASARKAKAASRASRGTRRSTRSRRVSSAIAESTDGPAGDPAVQLCRHDGAAAMRRRWIGASSIGSAHRCSTARSARRQARPAGRPSSARRWAWTSRQYDNSRLILIWGSNPITSNLHFWTRAQEAKRRGARLIAIDPVSQRDRREVPRAHRVAAGHRRRARTRHHASADRQTDCIDRDYVDRYTIGFDALAERAREWTPERVAATCGIAARAGRRARARLRHDQAGRDPPQLRHAARCAAAATPCARSPACPRSSVRGAIRPAARCCRRRALSRSTRAALERPDLIRGAPRTINMSAIGDALLDARDPPDSRDLRLQLESGGRRARFVARRRRIFARTTCSASFTRSSRPTPPTYADILLPATTQLEQTDVHNSYGHLYALANNPAIAPHRRSDAEHRGLSPARRADGLHRSVLQRQRRRRSHAHAFRKHDVRAHRHRLGYAEAERLAAAERAAALRAVRQRRFPDAVGQMRVLVRYARGARTGSAARVSAAAGVGGVQSGARANAIRLHSFRRRRATS